MDSGSGDGRIVIQAAQRGAYGLGVDLDPERVRDGRENVKKAGVSDDVAFLQQDLFETDVSSASVVTMYLFPEINIKLRPVLLEQLRPGTRVVSHAFPMGKWEADKTLVVEGQGSDAHRIYLWVIPADAAGQWQVDGQRFSWQGKQRFQSWIRLSRPVIPRLLPKRLCFAVDGLHSPRNTNGANTCSAAGSKMAGSTGSCRCAPVISLVCLTGPHGKSSNASAGVCCE